jgi:hypothetical protein
MGILMMRTTAGVPTVVPCANRFLIPQITRHCIYANNFKNIAQMQIRLLTLHKWKVPQNFSGS